MMIFLTYLRYLYIKITLKRYRQARKSRLGRRLCMNLSFINRKIVSQEVLHRFLYRLLLRLSFFYRDNSGLYTL